MLNGMQLHAAATRWRLQLYVAHFQLHAEHIAATSCVCPTTSYMLVIAATRCAFSDLLGWACRGRKHARSSLSAACRRHGSQTAGSCAEMGARATKHAVLFIVVINSTIIGSRPFPLLMCTQQILQDPDNAVVRRMRAQTCTHRELQKERDDEIRRVMMML